MDEAGTGASLMDGGSSPAPSAAPAITSTPDTGSQGAPPPTGTSIDQSSGIYGEWYGGLSQELQDDPFVKKYNSLEDAIKGGREASKLIGKSIQVPGEDATPDEWAKVYNKLGRPETADGYELQAPTVKNEAGEDIPIFELDETAAQNARESFHKLNLTPAQVQGVMELYGQQRVADMGDAQGMAEQHQVEMAQESESQLRQEWGDKYDTNLSIARKAAEKFGIMNDIKDLGLGNSSKVIKMLHSLSEHIGEAKLTGDYSSTGGGFEATIADIDRRLEGMSKADPEYNKLHQARINAFAQRYN